MELQGYPEWQQQGRLWPDHRGVSIHNRLLWRKGGERRRDEASMGRWTAEGKVGLGLCICWRPCLVPARWAFSPLGALDGSNMWRRQRFDEASLLRAPFLPLKGLPSPAGYGMHTRAYGCIRMCLPVSLCGGAALGSPKHAVNFSGGKCLHLLPEAKEFLQTNSPKWVPKS